MQGDFQRPDQAWSRSMDSGPSWSTNLNQQQQQHRYPPAPDSANGSDVKGNGNVSGSGDGKAQPPPKRGAKACTACRKGKNRCEGENPCKRCLANGTECVFEKPAAARTSNAAPGITDAVQRVNNLEQHVSTLAASQSQIQNTLSQILSLLPTIAANSSAATTNHGSASNHSHSHTTSPAQGQSQSPANAGMYIQPTPPGGRQANYPWPSPTTGYMNTSPGANQLPGMAAGGYSGYSSGPGSAPAVQIKSDLQGLYDAISPKNGMVEVQVPVSAERGMPMKRPYTDAEQTDEKPRKFPKLPGFRAPPHRFGTYGIIPPSSGPPSPSHSNHSANSSDSLTDDALPRESLNAPIEALQALASAADQAAVADVVQARKRKLRGMRMRKRRRPDDTPTNAFAHVVTKGLVSEQEGRELWDIFFSGCDLFIPLFDRQYDVFDSFNVRTPFSFNGILAVAARIRAGNGPLGPAFHHSLEEAQGIARSTLFGPCVRKEAVMAVVILSVWSQHAWLPSGHAMRMALDMNLHRALDKLANGDSGERSEAEERDLVVSARIWMNIFINDHLLSLGTGKPLLLRDDSSVQNARLLLSHPMVSSTDVRLIAGVELVKLRVRVYETLAPLHGKVDAQTVSFVRRMFTSLAEWHHEWDAIHRQHHSPDSVLVKLLEAELVYAQLWTVCVALRGCAWDKLPHDQRELAFRAKDAAMGCLEIFLHSPNLRKHLKYAVHEQMVMVSFAAVFLLKTAILFPSELPLHIITAKVTNLANMLSEECYAERYALTLRLMLASCRRKMGAVTTMPGTPRVMPTDGEPGLQSLLMPTDAFNNLGGEDLGNFTWPGEFSPSELPDWLKDGNTADLGLPIDGSDSLFLPPELASMFLPTNNWNFTFGDSYDDVAEAW